MTALPSLAEFDSVAGEAMVHAASMIRSGDALDTRAVLLALAYVHVRGRWEHIWLACSHWPDDIARQRGTSDPADDPRELWNGTELTATCAEGLRAAARIAGRHNLPIVPGVLFIGLITDPAAGAARALGVGTTIEHEELMHLAAEELLDVTGLSDTGAVPAIRSAPQQARVETPAVAPPPVRTLKAPTRHVFDIKFSPDGQMLACAAFSSLRAWNPATGAELQTIASTGVLDFLSVAFSPDGWMLASGGMDGLVRLWKLPSWERLRSLNAANPAPATGYVGVRSVAFSPDGRSLASGSTGCDLPLWLWDQARGKPRRFLIGHSGGVLSLAFSPDGQLLASGGTDGTIWLWDPRKGRDLRRSTAKDFLTGHVKGVFALAFSPDSSVLASAGADKTVRLWDPHAGEQLGNLAGHTGPVNSIVFNADGSLLASGSNDGTVRLWTPATGAQEHTVITGTTEIRCLAISPDGQLVASGGNGAVHLWSLNSIIAPGHTEQPQDHPKAGDSNAADMPGPQAAGKDRASGRHDKAIRPDNGGFRHWVPDKEFQSARTAQTPVKALCGWRWIPQTTSTGKEMIRLPVCPRCKAKYEKELRRRYRPGHYR